MSGRSRLEWLALVSGWLAVCVLSTAAAAVTAALAVVWAGWRIGWRLGGALLVGAAVLAVVAPSATSTPAGVQQARQEIRRLFGPQARVAFCIVWHESRWRADAVSPTDDVGLFQINYATHRRHGEPFSVFRARMSRPDVNVAYAYALWREAGWGPWVTQGRCR